MTPYAILQLLHLVVFSSAEIFAGTWRFIALDETEWSKILLVSRQTSDHLRAIRICTETKDCFLTCQIGGVYVYSKLKRAPEYICSECTKLDCWTRTPG